MLLTISTNTKALFMLMNNARIFIFFLIAAAAGTVLHECGHYIAGIMVGFKPSVHYMYTGCCDCLEMKDAAKRLNELAQYGQKRFLFTLGGPLQTILTGAAGLAGILTISRRRKIDAHNAKHLLWIVMAYFFSRQIFNTVYYFVAYFISGRWSVRADESKIFTYLHIELRPAYMLLLLGSSAILAWITFILVRQHRMQLILFGFLGSMAGYGMWIYGLGPLLLP